MSVGDAEESRKLHCPVAYTAFLLADYTQQRYSIYRTSKAKLYPSSWLTDTDATGTAWHMITGNCGVKERQRLQGNHPMTVYGSGRKCKLQPDSQVVPKQHLPSATKSKHG